MLSTIPREWQEPGYDQARQDAIGRLDVLESIQFDHDSIKDTISWLLDDSLKLAKIEGKDQEQTISDCIACISKIVARAACDRIDHL